MHRHKLPLAVILGLTLSLGGCATLKQLLAAAFQQPSLNFQTARVRDINFTGAGLDLVFRVENPNEFGVRFTSVGYDLKIDGRQLASGTTPKGIQIAPGGSSEVVLPFDLRFADFGQALLALYERDTVPWDINGHFAFDTPVGPLRLPYQQQGTLPVPKLPELQISGARVSGLSLTSATLAVDLEVRNNNQFALPLDQVAYGMKISGQPVGTGQVSTSGLRAGGTTRVTLPVKISFLSAGSAVQKAIQSGQIDLGLEGKVRAGPVDLPLTLKQRVPLR